MRALIRDFRYGLRVLVRNPGSTAVAVLTLALGIGATAAIFSVANSVLLRPLPFPNPDSIMTLWNTFPQATGEREEVSPPDFFDWHRQNRSFSELAAYEQFFYVLAGHPYPVRLRAVRVTGDFFAALGVNAGLGRTLLPSDDHPGVHRVVVLSDRLWRSQFGSDPSILGRTIVLNGEGFRVLGVMPAGFTFPYDVDLWSPAAWEPKEFDASLRQFIWLRTVARLKPGVTRAQAQADMAAIARRLEQEYPETNTGRGVLVVSLYEQMVGNARPALLVLLGAVGFLLLIACTNVANLLLARATTRQREVAVRAALGAGRLRLISQLMTEGVLLGLLGGAGGLLLTWWALDLVLGLNPGNIPRLQGVHVDFRVVGFAFVISLLTGLACSIAPAFTATRTDLYEWLRQGGGSPDNPRRRWLRGALVVVEIGLTQMLLIGGALLFQTFLHLRSVNPGFDPENLSASRFELSSRRYDQRSTRASFYRQVIEQVSALPGVRAAALSTTIPLHEVQLSNEFFIEGRPRPLPSQYPSASYNEITPGYFRTMGTRLLAGRFFSDADRAGTPAVVIINEAMARRFWPGESPVGESIRLLADEATPDPPSIKIVGVVEDVRQMALDTDVRSEIYLPYAQRLWRSGFLVVRAEGDVPGLEAAVRREVGTIDPGVALSSFRTMNDQISGSMDRSRFLTFLLGAFAALALTLAAVGVFGVVSYSVSQRTREFGIRMALGAQRQDIFKLVVGNEFSVVLVGVVLGLVSAAVLSRFLSSLLFEIVPTDALTYAGVALILSAVALAACYIPSRRATKVDPTIALRYE